MTPARVTPKVHVFVCAHRREDAGLGPGCGTAGDRAYDALAGYVTHARAHRDVWITRTRCLGLCPPRGCALAIYGGPRGEASVCGLWEGVEPDDALTLIKRVAGGEVAAP